MRPAPRPESNDDDGLLPEFVRADERACVGPFALYAPRDIPVDLTLWSGVVRADPTVRVSVLTTSIGDILSLWRDEDARHALLYEHRPYGTPSWLARRAHPGVTLDQLLRQESGRRPPLVLGIAVADALFGRGHRVCRARAPADVIVGFDGTVTVDGLDGDGWQAPGPPPSSYEDTVRGGLVAAALTGKVDFAACVEDVAEGRVLLDRVLDAVLLRSDVDLARDRAQLAAVVCGLFPDVVAADAAASEELSLLGTSTWAGWENDAGRARLHQRHDPRAAWDALLDEGRALLREADIAFPRPPPPPPPPPPLSTRMRQWLSPASARGHRREASSRNQPRRTLRNGDR
jgi:hypothetical protein